MNLEDYSKYYIQGSDHYLIPKDEFKELFNEMINWKEETIELKKQLEETEEKATVIQKELRDDRDNYYEILKDKYREQKEFINYLNSYIDLLNDKPDMLEETQKDILEEVLQKYKSIIGDDKNGRE